MDPFKGAPMLRLRLPRLCHITTTALPSHTNITSRHRVSAQTSQHCPGWWLALFISIYSRKWKSQNLYWHIPWLYCCTHWHSPETLHVVPTSTWLYLRGDSFSQNLFTCIYPEKWNFQNLFQQLPWLYCTCWHSPERLSAVPTSAYGLSDADIFCHDSSKLNFSVMPHKLYKINPFIMPFSNLQVVYYNLSLVPQLRNDTEVKPGDSQLIWGGRSCFM